MKLRDVVVALRGQRCVVVSERGQHTKWRCPCGGHSANVPRHRSVTPGVVGNIVKRLAGLPEGWLQ